MRYDNPFSDPPIGSLFETLLPDFVLAFAFFTALVYGVLAKRVQHQRSAVTVSATVAFALPAAGRLGGFRPSSNPPGLLLGAFALRAAEPSEADVAEGQLRVPRL